MCGIFGYVGPRDAVEMALEGIRLLEYRGYDSAGVAWGFKNGELIECCKAVGKVVALDEKLKKKGVRHADWAIAHTRWATHGKPSSANAHPFFDEKQAVALIHNGIIENYQELRRLLPGVCFTSETDTEAVVHLIAQAYEGDLLKAVRLVVARLKGAFALAVVHREHPEHIVVAVKESPLAIGRGNGEMFVASDAHAFAKYTQDAYFMGSGELAVITPQGAAFYDFHGQPIEKALIAIHWEKEEISKGAFAHFMLKEIFEQPTTVRNALLGRLDEEKLTASFEGLPFSDDQLRGISHIQIVACGTSWHAGLVAAYLLEEYARVTVAVDYASELRYRSVALPKGTLVMALSQSGETADTIAAMRELKKEGFPVWGLCNTPQSTLVREADFSILLQAGLEVGVAATKTFNAQLTLFALITLLLARIKGIMDDSTARAWIAELKRCPLLIEQVLRQYAQIGAKAQRYAAFDTFIFLGRNLMYPTCLEAALKLKEISYLHASGYPAGEMKHGPIALISEKCPTMAYCANRHTYEKMVSNLMEVKARNGRILAVAEEGAADIASIADDVVFTPPCLDFLAPIPASVVGQILAYEIAKLRGREIDQPRNLAKSVTVE